MKKHTLFLVLGRTATGKTTITRKCADELKMKVVKSYTTRPMRTTENEQSDHIFIKQNEVEKYKKDGFAAYTKIGEYEYFTTANQIHECDFYVIDPKGYYDMMLHKPENVDIVTIYITVPKADAIKRAKERGDDIQTFIARYEAENKQFIDFERSNLIDWRILNVYDVDDAVNKMERIVLKELDRKEHKE